MDTIYKNSPLVILESRLDWLTVTCKPNKRQDILNSRVNAWFREREAEGFSVQSFRTPFYEGRRTAGLAYGGREQDCMVSVSGEMAQRRGPQLITWADNVSRLDAQLTMVEPDISTNWASYVDKIAGLHASVRCGETSTRLTTSRPAGVTSYIGSPSSDRLLRCYDKHAESDGVYPAGAWRFEVQWRHKRALVASGNLLERSCDPQAVLSAVCGAYRDFAIDVPVHCIPRNWKDAGIRTVTDDQRRLTWLRTSIAPCVERLVDSVGQEPVLNALGFQRLTDTLESQARMLDKIGAFGDPLIWPVESMNQTDIEVR